MNILKIYSILLIGFTYLAFMYEHAKRPKKENVTILIVLTPLLIYILAK